MLSYDAPVSRGILAVAAAVVVVAILALGAGCGAATRGTSSPEARASISGEFEAVVPESTAATAVVSFYNHTAQPVRVLRYQVRWPGGQVIVAPRDLRVPAGGACESRLRIGPEAGDLVSLYDAPMAAEVAVLEVAAL